jgi:lysophospholipase L1-like esterase
LTVNELDRIKMFIDGGPGATWVFTGDSITHGVYHTHGWRSYPEHFAERVRSELQRHRDVVINTGVSGDEVGDLLEDLEARVLRFAPQVVSIMIGMNDAAQGPSGQVRFRTGLTALLGEIRRQAQAALILHTPNAITALDPSRADLPAYVEIVRAAAREHGAVLVDHYDCWVRRGSSVVDLLEDGAIHPNHYGHRLMARTLFVALGIDDAASPTCRLSMP